MESIMRKIEQSKINCSREKYEICPIGDCLVPTSIQQ